jgi:pterin-4a-carbinolamine dehydratase
MLTVELWSHARRGLTQDDFTVAAKIEKLPKDDLLSKKKYRYFSL